MIEDGEYYNIEVDVSPYYTIDKKAGDTNSETVSAKLISGNDVKYNDITSTKKFTIAKVTKDEKYVCEVTIKYGKEEKTFYLVVQAVDATAEG